MAKSTSKNNSQKATGTSGRMSFKSKLMLFIGTLGAIILLKQSSILLLVGMLPAIVAFIVDNTPHKSWAKTLFSFNLAGLLPSLVEVCIAEGNTVSSLQSHMSDMTMWLFIYGIAGLAWIIIWLMPLLCEQWIRFYYQQLIEGYRKKISRIDEEWNMSRNTDSKS